MQPEHGDISVPKDSISRAREILSLRFFDDSEDMVERKAEAWPYDEVLGPSLKRQVTASPKGG